ncbi:ASKHA domain-containing protein [Candidatus Omnitrophota bacterium]
MNNLSLLVDIGTTTVSGLLLDKKKNKAGKTDFVLNEQARFGDNLISRIDFSLKKKANKDLISEAGISSINKLIIKLLKKAKKKKECIDSVYCVCNTGVHHLVLKIDASSLICAPYKAMEKSQITTTAQDLGLKLKKDISVAFLPNIESFVGSDALSAILASQIYKTKSYKLAIDIGTNGEIILGNSEKIFVASTAAGPAFEAGHISCGMPAVEGAIESVTIKEDVIQIKVIGGGIPKGICGSGLIDATFNMLESGIINSSGKMNRDELILFKKGKKKISITQQDIRKIQIAKAAISAAIKILIKKAKIEKDDIKEIFITGSFGNTIDIESLIGIGLAPDIDKSRIKITKDGPLAGLSLYVMKKDIKNKLSLIKRSIRHMPMLGKVFNEQFISSLNF